MTSVPNTISAIFFDLDGTLIDTAPDFIAVLNLLCSEYEFEPPSYCAIHRTVSSGAKALVKLAFKIEESDAGFKDIHARLLSLYLQQVEKTLARPYPGILDLLTALENSKIKWGVVTNKPEKYSLVLLENLNLLQRCATLVCPDHVNLPKPDPEALIFACEQLACSTKLSIYVGDHPRDIEAGLKAGMFTIAAGYGYLPEKPEIEAWQADAIVKTAFEITDWLTSNKFLNPIQSIN